MKNIVNLFFISFSFSLFSQVITVNSTTTVPNLVQNVLLSNNGVPACGGTISNITWSTGSNFGQTNGIGSFTNTNPNFPLTNGLILTTGNVDAAPGPNTSIQSNGTNSWPGDAQLFSYIQGLGIDPGLISYNNASKLEFDFTPLTNVMSFDFVFASEEYGNFQCAYSDAFAFFLNNVTTGTPVENLALVPATTTPISVITIRDMVNNTMCNSQNVGYFGAYYGGSSAAAAPINFNGRTVKMVASKAVVAGQTYHIKFVVADRNDSALDSAVFLGNFKIGELISGTGQYDNVIDFSNAVGQAVCANPLIIKAGPVPLSGATYQWTLNGTAIPGATGHTYTVLAAGTYCVR